MGACATKPKVNADYTIPAPEPIDDMMKNTEEVKIVEEEKKIDQNDEKKKEDIGKVVEEGKPLSLATLLVEKKATPVVEAPNVTKAEETPKAAESPKGAVAAAAEEKATEKNEK